MRYSGAENAVLVGLFDPNQDVTIKVINLQTDALVSVTTDKCLESSHVPGAYRWSTSSVQDDSLSSGYHNLFYEMTASDGKKFYGKFIYGGYVDRDVVVDLSVLEEDHRILMEIVELINAKV